MKTKAKKIILAVLMLSIVVLFAACDSGIIGTEMIVDDNFAGTRVMSFDIKQADLSSWDKLGLFTPKVSEITGVLQESCPEQLTMEVQKSGNDATCVFTLAFTDMDDYTKKVEALLGKKPRINYEPASDEMFVNGITLAESFTSAELFGWAETALGEAYPEMAGKITLSGETGATVVVYNGVRFATTAKIDVKPVAATLDKITVETTRYGADDYMRRVYISLSKENADVIGVDRLKKEFFEPLTYGIEDIASASWDAEKNQYVIEMKQGNVEELERFTSTIFPGSTVAYSDLETGAFSESGTLEEHFSFANFPCTENGSANVELKYIAGDETTFANSSDSKNQKLTFKAVTDADVSIVSESKFVVDSVNINADITMSGKLTVSVMVGFPTKSSRSAAENAARYLSEQYKDTGVKVEAQQLTESTMVSGTDYTAGAGSEAEYALLITASGTPEKVSKMLSDAFGENNSFTVSQGSRFAVYRENTVRHSVDLTSLLEMASYQGTITYNLSADISKIQNVHWENEAGGGNADVLSGKTRKNNFVETNIGGTAFVMNYRYDQLNVISMIFALVLLVGVLGLAMVLISVVGNKLVQHRRKKKEDVALEAVRTVALATIPEDQRGEITELPPELTRRPMVVLQPRNDDGLDEDYDEPEGVILFASTLKILIISAIVLFFFPFCDIKKTGALMECSFSGWNLFFGKDVYGVEMAGISMMIILLIIPVLMLALLMARRVLPKMVIPVISSIGSLAAVFYLLNLPDTIEKSLNVVKAALGSGAYLTAPTFQMAYTYSIVIYVLLAIGCLLLLFTDLAHVLSQRRRKLEEED